ncbi:MAG TPA: CHAT domain-containing tetratricopeptide repeat protein [Thermoanaerobaculia bacterium]|nr:CHAT domain-containing tetratricopeptide repeat protein [Thermoanaerobaculia bacterium]
MSQPADGEVHAYLFDLQPGWYAGLSVEQQGVDVEVGLYDPQGRRLTLVDSPSNAQGPEPVPVVAEAAGTYRLEVRSLGAQTSPRRYEVRVEALRPATARDRSLVAAERLLAGAEALRSRDDEASLRSAVADAGRAADLFKTLGERGREGAALFTAGSAHQTLGEDNAALDAFRGALALFRESDLTPQVVSALLKLGMLHRMRGEPDQAVAFYQETLALSRRLGDRRQESHTLNNLGKVYEQLGRMHEALVHYEQAVRGWREARSRVDEAVTLYNLGHLYGLLGEPRKALDDLTRSLALLPPGSPPRQVATILGEIGIARALCGQEREASAPLRQALQVYRRIGDRRGEALTLNNLGWLLQKKGERREARRLYRQSLAFYRGLEDRLAEAWVLTNLAVIDDELGRPHAAVAAFERALPQLAASGAPEGEAGALLKLARARRHLGDLTGARTAAEAAITRVETLRGGLASLDLRSSFLASKQELYGFYVDLLMDLHRREPAAGYDARALEASEEARARSLLDMLTETRAERRRGDPAALLDLRQIQTEVVDPGTLLLEYSLGEERSFLWAVTPGSLASFELPARAVIEDAARRAYPLLAASYRTLARAPAEAALAELYRLLLEPVTPLLGRKRLLVAGDGALHYLPFGALLPEHEVVTLPSASTLAALRRDLAERRPAPGTVAVVADPVFDAADPRFARLPFSRREAEAILALAPPDRRLRALGVQASRKTVLGGALGRYRIVHFATHGVFDAARPELSGIALHDGFLRVDEIYRLRLPADLVVLSACQTALGREIRGEGLVGITRGFLYAGARALVVSLWEVEDEATAELMRRFYEEMLVRGRPPAAALRTAQDALRRQPGRSAPYYWAGFVLQGDPGRL